MNSGDLDNNLYGKKTDLTNCSMFCLNDDKTTTLIWRVVNDKFITCLNRKTTGSAYMYKHRLIILWLSLYSIKTSSASSSNFLWDILRNNVSSHWSSDGGWVTLKIIGWRSGHKKCGSKSYTEIRTRNSLYFVIVHMHMCK